MNKFKVGDKVRLGSDRNEFEIVGVSDKTSKSETVYAFDRHPWAALESQIELMTECAKCPHCGGKL